MQSLSKAMAGDALLLLPTIDTLTARCALKLEMRPVILSISEKKCREF